VLDLWRGETMNRRAFFSVLAGAAAASYDPERALWIPGRKLISIPKPRIWEPIEIGHLPLFSRIRNAGPSPLHFPAREYAVIRRPGCYKRIGNTVEPGEEVDLHVWGPDHFFTDDPLNARLVMVDVGPTGMYGFRRGNGVGLS
jgi:hypothetical protein